MDGEKRNIHIVLDLSPSMKTCVGAVYLFLLQLQRRMADSVGFTWSLTWFTGTDSQGRHPVVHEPLDGERLTGSAGMLLDAIRGLTISGGCASSPEVVREAVSSALNAADPNQGQRDWEQILFLFSDYRSMDLELSGDEHPGLRRAFLFVPQDALVKAGFRFVTDRGRTYKIGVQQLPLESLMETWKDEDWNLLLDMMS